MVEEVSGFLERISLNEEELLWKHVREHKQLDSGGKPQFLILGTDRGLTLARMVLKDCPGAQITIIEKEERVVAVARGNIKADETIKIITGEFPGVMPEDDFRSAMVLAKNLIYFVGVDKLAEFVEVGIKLLTEDGQTFYASTPFIVGGIVERRLRRHGIEFERHLIGHGASVFEFNKKPH